MQTTLQHVPEQHPMAVAAILLDYHLVPRQVSRSELLRL
jgi:hypothetical protein